MAMMHKTALPIQLDLIAAFRFERGIGRSDLLQLAPWLESARKTVVSAQEKQPPWRSDWRPQAMLEAYKRQRRTSLLWRLLQTSAQLRDEVDRLVVVGSPSVIAAGRALLAACCHPFHNELTRGERGGRPRIYFVPAQPDNDALQGLLDMLPHGRALHHVEERWGILGIDDFSGDRLLAELFSLFCEALQSTTGANQLNHAIYMGLSDSPMMRIAELVNCSRWVLDDANSTQGEPAFEAFDCPGILLAASLMGMDLVQYLRGLAAMSERFKTSPIGDNPPLDLAGLIHLLKLRDQIRGVATASELSALRPLAECFSCRGMPQKQLLVQLSVESVRRDRISITMSKGTTASGRSRNVSQTLPEVAARHLTEARERRAAAGLPTAVVHLPALEENAIGQLIQMLTTARTLESVLTLSPDS
jgi:glucose-6-phosphate isomerase